MEALKLLEIKKLRDEFLAKINEEWQLKWAKKHGGESFEFYHLKSQNAFLDDLLDDIEQTIKQKIGLEKTSNILISRDSLRRILKPQEQSSWQEKTKNTLSYYLGYEGWADFEQKNAELIISESKIDILEPKTSTSVKQTLLMFSVAALLIVVLVGIFKYYRKNDTRSASITLIPTISKGYPILLKVKSEVASSIKPADVHLLIGNEKLQYLQLFRGISLDSTTDTIPFNFFTPGLKKFTLKIKNQIVARKNYVVNTHGEWYGCARVKYAQIPNPYEKASEKAWYGEVMNKKNSETDWLSTPSFWEEYTHKNGSKTTYPNEILHFPDNSLSSGKMQKTFSRVAFVKVDEFALDVDSVSISFKAKRDNIVGEDCLSFMTQLYDEDNSKVEFYSSNNCEAINSTIESLATFSENDEIVRKKILDETESKLNKIAEDYLWHSYTIELKNKKMMIIVDDKILFQKSYNTNLKQLREIWFVFEGNGSIDDVILKNSSTDRLLFNDTFSK